MERPVSHSLDRTVNEIQTRRWREMSPGEKICLVGRMWQQARTLKRATLRSLHPEWDDQRLDAAVREAMGGKRS